MLCNLKKKSIYQNILEEFFTIKYLSYCLQHTDKGLMDIYESIQILCFKVSKKALGKAGDIFNSRFSIINSILTKSELFCY